VKVTDTNHESCGHKQSRHCDKVRDKPICVALMEFSPLQCTGRVGNKFPTKSTNDESLRQVHDTNHVAEFHDLFLHSRRNGIWA